MGYCLSSVTTYIKEDISERRNKAGWGCCHKAVQCPLVAMSNSSVTCTTAPWKCCWTNKGSFFYQRVTIVFGAIKQIFPQLHPFVSVPQPWQCWPTLPSHFLKEKKKKKQQIIAWGRLLVWWIYHGPSLWSHLATELKYFFFFSKEKTKTYSMATHLLCLTKSPTGYFFLFF